MQAQHGYDKVEDDDHKPSAPSKQKGLWRKAKRKMHRFADKMVHHLKGSHDELENVADVNERRGQNTNHLSTNKGNDIVRKASTRRDNVAQDEHDNGQNDMGIQLGGAAAPESGGFKMVDNENPVSSMGASKALQPTTIECHHFERPHDDQLLKSGHPDDAQESVLPTKELDTLCTKKGVHADNAYSKMEPNIGGREGTKGGLVLDSHQPSGFQSPLPTAALGADEQTYRPVLECDQLKYNHESTGSLPSESITATLYSDVLADQDKLRNQNSGT
ncbi:hypothetical protein KP509_15G039200 [Ceratopteris richardii]|uniref:Uncharacterized protein n=1 Tax=Ceratopteris richardii TaxID=49495 RepID=A0A8T2T697_CERRI|nr:hypothetical protein KP509_15G039200 [Ceratopteris richardii]